MAAHWHWWHCQYCHWQSQPLSGSATGAAGAGRQQGQCGSPPGAHASVSARGRHCAPANAPQALQRTGSAAQLGDPYTLVITLDAASAARGHLYLDDGATHDFVRRGAFRLREFAYEARSAARHTLRSSSAAGGKAWAPENAVERVLVAGLQGRRPQRVTAAAGGAAGAAANSTSAVDFSYDADADVLTLRKPGVKAAYDFEIVLEF